MVIMIPLTLSEVSIFNKASLSIWNMLRMLKRRKNASNYFFWKIRKNYAYLINYAVFFTFKPSKSSLVVPSTSLISNFLVVEFNLTWWVLKLGLLPAITSINFQIGDEVESSISKNDSCCYI